MPEITMVTPVLLTALNYETKTVTGISLELRITDQHGDNSSIYFKPSKINHRKERVSGQPTPITYKRRNIRPERTNCYHIFAVFLIREKTSHPSEMIRYFPHS